MNKTIKPVRSPHPEATFAEGTHSSPVPERVLNLVELALSDYQTRDDWARVREAILLPHADKLKPAPVQDRFLSTEEICELLHVSRVTIFRYVRAGKLKPHKLGRRNLYSLNEVLATLKNEEVPND